MTAPAEIIIHGLDRMEIEPERLVTRARGLDQTTQVWLSQDEHEFANGGAPPRRPHMRITECETRQSGGAWEHRIQASGFAGVRSSKRISSSLSEGEEGWDGGQETWLTRAPADFVRGAAHPTQSTLWCVEAEKEQYDDLTWQVTPRYKGILNSRARKRRITVGNQVVSSSVPYVLTNSIVDGEPFPFVNEYGEFTGWGSPRYSAIDTSRVVVTDTFLSTDPPPTDQLPGHLTPENAPNVKDIFSVPWFSPEGFTFNWPWGWSLKGITAERLLDLEVWLISITTEFVPVATPR